VRTDYFVIVALKSKESFLGSCIVSFLKSPLDILLRTSQIVAGGSSFRSISECNALRNACSVSIVFVDPALAQLDRAHESSRAFRSTVGKGEVGMLVAMTNQRPQVPRSKVVFRDDLVPGIRIFLDVGSHAHWRVRPGLYAECFGQSCPG